MQKNKYEVKEKTDLIKNKKQIDENFKKNQFQIVDARSRERFEEKLMSLDQDLEEAVLLDQKIYLLKIV